jgi:hypothetical protein
MNINLTDLAIGLLSGGGVTGFIMWLFTRKSVKKKSEAEADIAQIGIKKAKVDVISKTVKIYQDLNDNLVKELNRERQNAVLLEKNFTKQIEDLKSDFEKRLANQDRSIQALKDEVQVRAKAQDKSDSLYALAMKAIAQQSACQTQKESCPIYQEYERLIKEIKA